MLTKRYVLGAVVVSLVLLARTAHSDPASARDAYRQGKSAYDAGDFIGAARSFAEADALAPNDAVLDLAIASTVKADEPTLGMSLVERAEGRGLIQAAKAGRDAFQQRVGSLIIVCPEGSRCGATVDGAPMGIGASRWYAIGEHTIKLDCDAKVEQIVVRVEPQGRHEVRPTLRGPGPLALVAPPSEPAKTPSVFAASTVRGDEFRPNAKWFWGSLATTVVLGGITVGSGLDVIGVRDQFAADRSNTDLASRGESAELRTNILLTVTGVAALATATLAYFTFRPQHSERGVHASR